jgi:PAS domain S-box-containing protein
MQNETNMVVTAPNAPGTHPDLLPCLEPPAETGRQFDDLPIGIYRYSAAGRFLAANHTLLRMFGCAGIDELNDGAFRESGFTLLIERPELRAKVDREGERKGFESESVLSDGSTFCARESVRAVRARTGEILFYEGTVEAIGQ